ncbi:CsgG/HfaB family protein [Phascolarctobacterium succinatutens]|uniref:CsgG/HfaB family protein n=1 Tax=Phascolarctobacterium succinatutens TaxID=626940 RepID=UPI003FD81A71
MLKKFLLSFSLAMLWSSHCFAAAIAKDANVAVMDFGTRPGATTSEISINNAEYTSSEYIINGLVNKHCFNIMDKDMVMHRLQEKQLKTVGLIDPDTAKKIGSLLNTRYIIYGNVTNVSVSDTGTQILTNIGGGVNVCTVKAHVIARVMDVETGDILMAVKGDGKSKSSFVKLHAGNGLTGVKVLKIGTVNVTMDSVHNAIAKAAEDIAGKMAANYI